MNYHTMTGVLKCFCYYLVSDCFNFFAIVYICDLLVFVLWSASWSGVPLVGISGLVPKGTNTGLFQIIF